MPPGFTIARIGRFDGISVVVSRTGYTGELGLEVWCHPKDATEVWDAIFEAGKQHELIPLETKEDNFVGKDALLKGR